MDTKTAIFTFFTLLLLYTVSAARPTVDLLVINPTVVRTDVASDASKILLPREKAISDKTTKNNLQPEMEKTAKNDLTKPHMNFSQFRPISRKFQGRPHQGLKQTGTQRRPCIRHSQYMIPATKIYGRKDQVTPEKTDNSRSKTFRGEVPKNWSKAKHHYGFPPQDNNHTNKNHRDKNVENVENVMKPRNVFDEEKMKSLRRKQNQKKSDYKDGLMKNIRKFLKHTFD